VFGDAWMDRYTRRGARRRGPERRATTAALATRTEDSG
jgi:hypothetical protein